MRRIRVSGMGARVGGTGGHKEDHRGQVGGTWAMRIIGTGWMGQKAMRRIIGAREEGQGSGRASRVDRNEMHEGGLEGKLALGVC